MTGNQLYIDRSDLKQLENDLNNLGSRMEQVSVGRRAIKKAGAIMLADIKRNATQALDDFGKLSGSIKFRSKSSKRLGMVSVWIQPVYNLGGELGTIFEKGTDDRYHKKKKWYSMGRWWVGRIQDGKKKTSMGENELGYLLKGFLKNAISTGDKMVKNIGDEVDEQIRKSKKLTKT